MSAVLRLFLLSLLMFGASLAHSADVRFNGVKPAVIIDVRTPQEFAAGHVDGAVNIPYDQIDQGIASLKGLKKDSTILLYCHSGRRSAIARETLADKGFKQVMNGGAMTSVMQNLKTCSAKAC